MTDYLLLNTGSVIRRADGAGIPADPNNVDYAEYLAWVAAGNQPDTQGEEPAAVPMLCSPAQGLVALYAVKGITEQHLLAAIERIADPIDRYTAKIGVTRTTEWRRDSQTVEVMRSLLGLTSQDMDELFTYAVHVAAKAFESAAIDGNPAGT